MYWLLFALFFIGAYESAAETCPFSAESIDTVLLKFELPLEGTEADKEAALVGVLGTYFPDVQQTLGDEDLVDLASMVHLILTNVPDFFSTVGDSISTFLEIRVFLERLVLTVPSTIHPERLTPIIGLMTTRDLILLFCAETPVFEQQLSEPDVVEGCYDNSSLTADLTLSIGVSDVEDVGKLKCLGYCRTQKFLFSYENSGGLCNCFRDVLATRLGSPAGIPLGPSCEPSQALVLSTGIGHPTKSFVNLNSAAFDPLVLDGVAVDNNTLIGIQEVVFPNSQDQYFVAVYSFVVALFKLNVGTAGLYYEYMTHQRWDGPKATEATSGTDSWIKELDQESSDFLNAPTTSTPANYQAAAWFALVPMFVKQSANLYSRVRANFTDTELEQQNNLAGTPYAGGLWCQQLLILHEDEFTNFPDVNLPQVTALRLLDEGFQHLNTIDSERDDGSFFVRDFTRKNAVSAVTKLFGRRTLVLIGTCNEATNSAESLVEGFEMTERQKSYTPYASYGQVVFEKTLLSLNGFQITAIDIAELSHSFLLVLDRTELNGVDSRLRVFKIKDVDTMEQIDETILAGNIYTGLKFFQVKGKGNLLLTSDNSTMSIVIGRRGRLAGQPLEIVEAPTVAVVPQVYTKLGNEAAIMSLDYDQSSSCTLQVYTPAADKVETMTNTIVCNGAHDAVTSVSINNQPILIAGYNYSFDIFSIQPSILPVMDSSSLREAEWNTLQARIDVQLTSLNATFKELNDSLSTVILDSGTVINDALTLNKLTVSESIILPAGSLNDTSVTFELTTAEETVSVDYGNNLNLKLLDVESVLNDTELKIQNLATYAEDALSANSEITQNIAVLTVGKLEADQIGFFGTDITLNITTLKSGELSESLDDFINDVYTKDTNPAVKGTKSFNSLSTKCVDTQVLTDGTVSIEANNLLLKSGNQTLTADQIFNMPIVIENIDLETGIGFKDSGSSLTITAADLTVNNVATNLQGSYHFTGSVVAPNITALTHTTGSINLNEEFLDSIVLTGDETISINGTLVVNVAESCLGSSINVKDGMVNNINLKELSDNAAMTHCSEVCIGKEINFSEKITIEGNVEFLKEFGTPLINSLPVEDYVKKVDFFTDEFVITGNKTMKNTLTANIVKAATFNGYTLDQFITRSTDQTISGLNIFNAPTQFSEIAGYNASSVPLVDGQNFLTLFRSDLLAIQNDSPWLEDTVTADVEFSYLNMTSTSSFEASENFNGMNVPDNLEQVVLNTDQEVTITGAKTFESEINLSKVSVDFIISGGENYTTDDFVNIKLPQAIDGTKTFTKAVTMQDIFMVGTATVNDIDFTEILDCYVNINDNSSDAIVIDSLVYFDTIQTPEFVLERNPVIPNTYCPSAISLEAAFRLLTNDSIEYVSDSDSKTEIFSTDYVDDVQSDYDFALEYMVSKFLIDVFAEDILGLTLAEKKLALQLKIQSLFTLSDSPLTDLELVQTLCRCLTVNGLCAQEDLARNDADNVFGAVQPIVQHFNKGLYADTMAVNGVVHMNVNDTVFGVDVEKLELERVSLSRNQILTGNYTFSNLRMDTNGTYEGHILVEFEGQTVDSVDYRSKFLNYKDCDTVQKFTAKKQIAGLKAESVTATKLTVYPENQNVSVDIANLFTNGISTVNDEIFEDLTFGNNVVYNGNIESGGLLDGINVVDLARDLVVNGPSIVVNSDVTITGTDSSEITFGSVKVLSVAPNVTGSVVPFVENGEVFPTVVFKPCTRTSPVPGLLEGILSNSSITSDLDDCLLNCRNSDCAGLSFNEGTGECRLMMVSGGITEDAGFISIVYSCWFQIQSVSSMRYLSIDRETDTLVTSEEPDSWRTMDGLLVHRATGVAIACANVSVGVELLTADGTDENQIVSFSEAEEFKIINQKTNFMLNEADNYEVHLVSQDTEGDDCYWKAGFDGEKFSSIVGGVPVTRILTKSTDQVITGELTVVGDVLFDSTITSDTLGELDVKTVAARYSYSTAEMTHLIAGDLELIGDLNVTELTADSFDGRSFTDFVADIIPKTSDSPISVTGTKIMESDVTLNTPNTKVTGTVGGFGNYSIDLDDLYADTAFIDAEDLTFLKMNTFSQNEDETLSVDIAEELTSSVGMLLENPVLKDTDVDLSFLKTHTIPRISGDPASVAGTVVFSKNLTATHSVDIASFRGTTGDSFLIPDDVITVKDSSMNVSLDGNDRLFEGVTTGADQVLSIEGQIFGRNETDFRRVLYKDGDQNITADLSFLQPVSTLKDLEMSGTLNGINPADNFVFLDAHTTLTGDYNFTGTLTVEKLNVTTDLVNGYLFTEMAANLFDRDTNQTILEEWHIMSDTTFDLDVVGNDVEEDGEGVINGQKVLDLKAVNHIYEKVHAVKVSAQAEAATMCDFVSDLQESYLVNQGIKQFDLHSTFSDMAANFSCAELVFSGGVDRLFVFVIDGSVIKVLEKMNDTLELRASTNLVGENGVALEGRLALGGSFDFSEPGGDYNIVVLVETSNQYSYTLVYRLTGSEGSAAIHQACVLEGLKTIAKLGSEVYGLGYDTDTEGEIHSRIEMLETEELKDCVGSLKCAAIARKELWTGSSSWAAFSPTFVAKLDVVKHRDADRVFAFNEQYVGNSVDTPRMLYVSTTSEMPADSEEMAECKLSGNLAGTIQIKEVGNGVHFTGTVTKLSPGEHGFHVHHEGALGNQCADAGGHYNPTSSVHGSLDSSTRHAGDLGNILATADQSATIDKFVDNIDLGSYINRSIVVHAGEDDLGQGGDSGSLATGNAGGRLDCCLINRVNSNKGFTLSFEVVNYYNPIGPSGDFSLLSIHNKVMLVSSDGLLRVDEIDVATNSTVETIQLSKLDGQFRSITRQLNFLGDFNLFTALRDDKEVVFLEYAGLEGLNLRMKADAGYFISGISSTSMISNRKGASYLAFVGRNDIKLLIGKVNNPVTQVEITCPKPELSPSLISTDPVDPSIPD